MTENEKIELFDKWYDENYDEWAEGEEGIALREELEQAFMGGIAELEKENAELKEKLSNAETSNEWYRHSTYGSLFEQIAKAKEIIKNLLILKNDHYGNTKIEWRVKVTEQAEQFLKEEQNVFNQ